MPLNDSNADFPGSDAAVDFSLAWIYSRFSFDVTAAMLVYRTIAKKVFWEFDSIIMQNFSDILPLSCTPTWPSHHVTENQEYVLVKHIEIS